MDAIDSANHDDDHTDRPGTPEGAEKDSQSACKLRQPNQVAIDQGKVLVRPQSLAAPGRQMPKENAAAVMQSRERAGYAR